ncbi:hypothetical protein NPIL_332441 [Nephila pilipes]|uniref:Uncharacterized protein n=1 Tax=Nephila pilipes TaxID=299642 RepID=A0A8X6T704_NEPPI|nr:hypothetical protein NPIL_332441 [Nephila pilipes]
MLPLVRRAAHAPPNGVAVVAWPMPPMLPHVTVDVTVNAVHLFVGVAYVIANARYRRMLSAGTAASANMSLQRHRRTPQRDARTLRLRATTTLNASIQLYAEMSERRRPPLSHHAARYQQPPSGGLGNTAFSYTWLSVRHILVEGKEMDLGMTSLDTTILRYFGRGFYDCVDWFGPLK